MTTPLCRRYLFKVMGAIALSLLLPQLAKGEEVVRPLFIEGYTGQTSYAPGEDVTFHVSTSAPTFSMEIGRIGVTKEIVWKTETPAPGAEYPVPEKASSHGCAWPIAVKVKIPTDWRSGYYEVDLRVADNGGKYVSRGSRTAQSSCFFVVRSTNPGRDTKILLQLSTNTYNAYNNWGGTSLYAYNGRAGLQGNRVSFDRPPQSQFSRWEKPFVQWAEGNGYQIDYVANSDLELHPELLANYKLMLSVGHDEYWSGLMRDNLEDWITKGGNVAFFSGNTCCWQVRTEDKGRALTCFKQNYHVDPVFQTRGFKTLSTAWSHHLLKRPENELTGVGFLSGGFHKSHGQIMNGSGAFTVQRPEHWIFEGTKLTRNGEFGGKDTIVGYECDGCELEWKDGLPFATFKDGTQKTFEVLCTAPAKWHPDDAEWYEKWDIGRSGTACMGIYTRGGTVFTAATTGWSFGLRGKDPTVMTITKNILDRLSK